MRASFPAANILCCKVQTWRSSLKVSLKNHCRISLQPDLILTGFRHFSALTFVLLNNQLYPEIGNCINFNTFRKQPLESRRRRVSNKRDTLSQWAEEEGVSVTTLLGCLLYVENWKKDQSVSAV